MAAQFLPIVKAIAPYLAQIATVAIPAFTSKKESTLSEDIKSDPVVAQQIEELQAAASQNAQSVKVLAKKLQQAIEDIENTAQVANRKIAAYKIIIVTSFSLSVISLTTCVFVLVR